MALSNGDYLCANQQVPQSSGVDNPQPKHKRVYFTRYQRELLSLEFDIGPYPNQERRRSIALQLNVPEKSIQLWFTNHRHRSHTQRLSYVASVRTSKTLSSRGHRQAPYTWTRPSIPTLQDCLVFPSLPNYFWPTIASVEPILLMSSYQDAPIDYSTSSRSSTSHSSVKSEDVLPFFPNQTFETILRTDINNSYERDWVNLNGHQYFHQSMVNQNMWLGGVCFDSSYYNASFNYNCDAALV